jgi:hypothetical protein
MTSSFIAAGIESRKLGDRKPFFTSEPVHPHKQQSLSRFPAGHSKQMPQRNGKLRMSECESALFQLARSHSRAGQQCFFAHFTEKDSHGEGRHRQEARTSQYRGQRVG